MKRVKSACICQTLHFTLKAHGFNLYYYDNKKTGEVDYLIDDMEHLSVLPLEIKSGKDYQVHSALDKFLQIKEIKDSPMVDGDIAYGFGAGVSYHF